MPLVKLIPSSVWSSLPELDLETNEDLFPQLGADTYRPVLSDVASVAIPGLSAGSIVETNPVVGDTLTVTGATAVSGANYQWQRNQTDIPGESGPSLNTTGLSAGSIRRAILAGAQGPVYTAEVTLSAPSSGDTIAPVFETAVYDQGTQALDLELWDASGAATVVWALSDQGVSPSFSVGGGWSGATNDTGFYGVTVGVTTIALPAPADNSTLTLYAYDADNNLSVPTQVSVMGANAVPPQNFVHTGNAASFHEAAGYGGNTDAFTFAGWFRPDNTTGNRYGFQISGRIRVFFSYGEIDLLIKDDANAVLFDGPSTGLGVADNTVHHLYIAADLSNDTLVVELDGTPVTFASATALAPGSGAIDNARALSLLAQSTGPGDNPFQGAVADLVFHDGIIPNADLYNDGLAPDLAEVVNGGPPLIWFNGSATQWNAGTHAGTFGTGSMGVIASGSFTDD